ncbi:thiosulfate sulfurtransferase domain protein [Ancylostoma duodenale]|uniref:Thiosulfate sulfurtransferase domain protein n=1 Tax=Ancylostoma duodenale TaxID=51022 RepID=A0A0C2G6B7_9BILA|nr:thiosulfate sulfurtransferase domain protein [Ancylostoma duodenale]
MAQRDPRAYHALRAPCTTSRRDAWMSDGSITAVDRLVRSAVRQGTLPGAMKAAFLDVFVKYRTFSKTVMIRCIHGAFFHRNVHCSPPQFDRTLVARR